MFKFDKEQEVFDFAGVKMGGQPGEYPTVLAGTIFYGGHNIINDELTGDFDKARAETLLNDMAEISDGLISHEQADYLRQKYLWRN